MEIFLGPVSTLTVRVPNHKPIFLGALGNPMFRPVPNDAIYFLVNKNSIEDFFSMMKYSLYATKNEKLISDLNEAFVENNPCFGNSITKFHSKIPQQKTHLKELQL